MKIEIGDRITFRAATRDGNRKMTRVVNGFWLDGTMPTVRAHGWSNFIVRLHEIIEVHPRDCDN